MLVTGLLTRKMLEKLHNIVFCNNHRLIDLLHSLVMIYTIDLNNISPEDDNFDEDDPETIIYVMAYGLI